MVEDTTTISGVTPTGYDVELTDKVDLGNGTSVSGYKYVAKEGEAYSYEVTRLVPKEGTGYTKKNTTIGGGARTPSGGGGGSDKKENPYDKFYNTLQKLNAELRKRNKLEREYTRLLDRANVSAEELAKLNQQQMDSLQQEKETREWLLGKREEQMTEIETEYGDMSQYASYDNSTSTITIDWEAIEALYESGDEDDIERLEEYISKLEEQIDLMEE
jgi:chromosome segregation ATPase